MHGSPGHSCALLHPDPLTSREGAVFSSVAEAKLTQRSEDRDSIAFPYVARFSHATQLLKLNSILYKDTCVWSVKISKEMINTEVDTGYF